MREVLARICELQPSYSSSNSPAMQERGRLVRFDLADAIRTRLPMLRSAFDPRIDDLAVEASDGIGRKTEAPWVRVYSDALSPNPRTGFYLVIHFAADGSAVFVTVGCGSTVWSGGDLRPIADDELDRRTSWARDVVTRRWGTIAPFAPEMRLGAKAALPRTFEKATALALRIAAADLGTADIDAALVTAAERLGAIYAAQLDGRDVSPGDRDAADIEALARPRTRPNGRQGFGLTAAERRAVELRAMAMARKHLEGLGFRCKDTSDTHPYDLLAEKDDRSLKVEVKGTTADVCESVLMTRNEVHLHRSEAGRTGLVIVSGITLDRTGNEPTATGGSVEALLEWAIGEWEAEPIAFQLHRPDRRG